MSEQSTLVTAEHFRYIAEHTAVDDAFLTALKQAAVDEGLPQIWIAPEQAALMQIVLRAMGAREVVEVGTLGGYSAISMARALPDGGRVRTIEVDEKHAAFARRWVEKSDVADRVIVIHGSAVQVLPTLGSGTADAVFIDADKENYPRYLEQCVRIVRPGGAIMVDNAFAFGELLSAAPKRDDVEAIRRFNDLIAGDSRLQSVIVPLGDGCWLAVRRA